MHIQELFRMSLVFEIIIGNKRFKNYYYAIKFKSKTIIFRKQIDIESKEKVKHPFI